MVDIAIIGTGPAGISAAINAKIRQKSILLFGEASLSHKVEISKEINNYVGMPAVSGEELVEKMKRHLDDMDIEITTQRITGVYKMKDKFVLLANRTQFEARSVILALGAETVKPLPMERELLGRGVSYCATCDGMLYQGKRIAVYADNPHMEEEVKYLADLAGEVYYYPSFETQLDAENIHMLSSKPASIFGEKVVEGITLQNGDEVKVDGVFMLKQAVSADVLLAKLDCQNGAIVVDRGMHTSVEGCFAAGDCTGTPYQISKAVGEGNIAAHSAFTYLANDKAEDLTIKKLTRGNPTMAAKFEALHNEND